MNMKPLTDCLRNLIDKGVPGLELIVCRDHQTLFHECMGNSDYDRIKPTTPSDRYWMYSCTKPVTAATAMHAVEKGLIGLDDPVGKYLPAFCKMNVEKDGKIVPAEKQMTVRQLFTMSAGLDYNMNRESIRKVLEETNHQATTVQIAEAIAQDPLCFEPGEQFRYSLCHDMLAAVVEAAGGMSFRDYMKKNILDPLGMVHTGFWTSCEPAEGMAAQYAYNAKSGKAEPCERKNSYVISPNYFSGGAGLVSCAEDYIRFTDALACGGVSADGVRILKKETIDLMRTEQIPQHRANGTFGCTCGADYGYGLGVRTRIAQNEGVACAMGEFGWDGAAGADMGIDPDNRISYVYVQHVLGWPDMVGIVHLQIRDALYPLLGL